MTNNDETQGNDLAQNNEPAVKEPVDANGSTANPSPREAHTSAGENTLAGEDVEAGAMEPDDTRPEGKEPDDAEPDDAEQSGADADGEEAPTGKEGKKKRTVKQEILSWIGLLLAAVAIATVVRALLMEPIKVDGRSMLETLQDGEIVLVTKPKMLLGRLERGDVVICRFPTREKEFTLPVGASLDLSVTNHTLFVKRLVALPGDTVAVIGGVLYVNDQAVQEPYVTYPSRADYPPRRLGADEYMVMGDNRANSHDSRSSDVGPLTKDMIVGRAAFVLFPLDRFGTVR